MGPSKGLVTTGAVIASVLLYVLCIGYQKRSRIARLRKQGVATPEGWSWWMGHMMVLQRQLDRLPPDANVYMAMEELVRKHSDTEAFALDLWPVFDQVLMVSGPETSIQVSNKFDLPKPKSQHKSMLPIVGGPSLISMNDSSFKFWRGLLNPGFSIANMLDRVPSIVDAAEIFCQQLQAHADKDMVLLDELTTRLTMDIITKSVLDIDLDHQRTPHPLAHALNTILAWHSFWDPRILLNPLRPPVQWYYGRVMDSFIQATIEQRFSEIKQRRSASSNENSLKSPKSVISLAIEDYISQKQLRDKKPDQDMPLDKDFISIAANQVRLFIFAGNDSTSSSIVYVFHSLAKHPEVLRKLQQEHDEVFGTDITGTAADMLKEDPRLLNRCPYTLAVVKETLRLYPPASSLREGSRNVSLTDRHGNIYPTDGLGVTIMHRFVHVNPRFWPRPKEFLPERWLAKPGEELYVDQNSGAYRPFEHGPRNCIGQTLVYNEIRIVVILVARRFAIQPAYEEWDIMQRKNEGYFRKILRQVGLFNSPINTVNGERAYQTVKAGSHPADSYPCRIKVIE